MSTDRGMDKDVIYINNGILLSHKKEWNNAATWKVLTIIILSEARQRKANIMWYHLYVESKNDTNKLIYKTEIDP